MIKWEGDTDIVHGLEPFAHLDPVLKAWALDARFVEPMCDFVGDAHPSLFTEKLNLKRPGIGGVNPMHQDYPYWIGEAKDPARVATAMLFLDDATLENGCLQVAPGSHHLGRWRNRTDSDEFGANEIDQSAYARCRDATAAAESGFHGDVRLFARAQLGTESIRSSSGARCCSAISRPDVRTMVEKMIADAEARRREKAQREAKAGTQ